MRIGGLLARLLLFAVSLLPATADNLFVFCGGVPIGAPIEPDIAGEYVLPSLITCGGTTLAEGKGVKNDSGDPSRLNISGTFTRGAGGNQSPYTFTLGGYTNPNTPTGVGWLELHGYFQLVGEGATAQLIEDGTLNGVPLPGIDVSATRPQGGGDVIFNRVGLLSPEVFRGAGWTLSVTVTPNFGPTAEEGSRIVFTRSMEGQFIGTPEPAPVATMSITLAAIGLTVRRKRRKLLL